MHFSSSSLLSLLLVTSVTAKAIPRALTENEIIVWGAGGRVEIMNKSSYALLASSQSPAFNITSPTPTSNTTWANSTTKRDAGTGTVDARCSKETIWSMNPVTTFLNWDVIMSVRNRFYFMFSQTANKHSSLS